MSNTYPADSLSPASIEEFLGAYPFNIQREERENETALLVSNREDSFELKFNPLRLDGLPIPIYDLLERIAPGDESVLNDYRLHVERWKDMSESSFQKLHDRLEGDPKFMVNGETASAAQWADEANKINVETDSLSFELDSMEPLLTTLIDQTTFVVEHPIFKKLRFVFAE